jgi:hypothetical protein
MRDYDTWFYNLDFDIQLDILDEYEVNCFEDLTSTQQQEVYRNYKEKGE